MKVRIQIDSTSNILAKRKLGKNGPAQQMFTKECAKAMNNYVPYKSGTLKDINVKINIDNVTYFAPYAAKQYYLNKGNGIGGINNGGLRGKMWDKRMWADNKDTIINKVCSFIGGRRV